MTEDKSQHAIIGTSFGTNFFEDNPVIVRNFICANSSSGNVKLSMRDFKPALAELC